MEVLSSLKKEHLGRMNKCDFQNKKIVVPIVFRLGSTQLQRSLVLVFSSTTKLSFIGVTVKEVVCKPFVFFPFFFFFSFFLSSLLNSMAVRRMTSAKGTIWQRTSQQSTILMSEVGGNPSILLMKMVVITSMVVRFKEEGLEESGGKGDGHQEHIY